jgi:hypothetical protein
MKNVAREHQLICGRQAANVELHTTKMLFSWYHELWLQ